MRSRAGLRDSRAPEYLLSVEKRSLPLIAEHHAPRWRCGEDGDYDDYVDDADVVGVGKREQKLINRRRAEGKSSSRRDRAGRIACLAASRVGEECAGRARREQVIMLAVPLIT